VLFRARGKTAGEVGEGEVSREHVRGEGVDDSRRARGGDAALPASADREGGSGREGEGGLGGGRYGGGRWEGGKLSQHGGP